MEFSDYKQVPQSIAEELIKKAQEEKKERCLIGDMLKTDQKKAIRLGTDSGLKDHGLPPHDNIINLKERSFMMLKKDLTLRNPLRLLGKENQDILSKGGFGAVLARAGVGKTAIMVQLSLETLLRGKNVLHVSLSDPVNKVSLWYKEVFHNLADQYNATAGQPALGIHTPPSIYHDLQGRGLQCAQT